MGAYAQRKIAQLSGGQQQRVALARALVIRPRCLLLDEPLSNLDAKLRLEMRSEIRRVCKEFGLTAIYVTHDQKEALSISDRMAVLEGGRIAQIGTPAEVYRRPRGKVVADFIGETNFLPARVVGTDGAQVTLETGGATFYGVTGDPDWRPVAGDAVTLSIRPEAWSLHESPNATNSLAGRIGDSVYLGEVAQYAFETAAGRLKIFELNPRIEKRSGEREYFASAEPGDVVVLKN
jgi:iron(III) transport system ATP-binding protein